MPGVLLRADGTGQQAQHDLNQALCFRLYSQARENQNKLTEARRARDAEMELTRQASRHSMTWVSQELMKGRTGGEYGNYGERLYVEGMLEHERKKAAVCSFLSSSWRLHRMCHCNSRPMSMVIHCYSVSCCHACFIVLCNAVPSLHAC